MGKHLLNYSIVVYSCFTRLNICVKNFAMGNLWAPPAWRESSSPASSRSSLRRVSSACRAAFWPAASVRLCWQLASCACAADSCEESSCSLSWSRASSCENYIEISPFLCTITYWNFKYDEYIMLIGTTTLLTVLDVCTLYGIETCFNFSVEKLPAWFPPDSARLPSLMTASSAAPLSCNECTQNQNMFTYKLQTWIKKKKKFRVNKLKHLKGDGALKI